MWDEMEFDVKRVSGLLLGSWLIAACAVSPSKPAVAADPEGRAPTGSLQQSWEAYQRRDFDRALSGFDQLSRDTAQPDETRRQAFLGLALVRLSTDPGVRDLPAARGAVDAASALQSSEESTLTSMLAGAVSALWTVESENQEISRVSGGAERENQALRQEVRQLKEEQARLNQSIRELTEISLSD